MTVNVTLKLVRCSKRCRKVEVQESSPLTRVRGKENPQENWVFLGVFQPLHHDTKKPVTEEKYFSNWLIQRKLQSISVLVDRKYSATVFFWNA